MTLSPLQTLVIPTAFVCLMALMLVYWYQAALFSYTRHKRITSSLLFASISLLTLILVMRWVESKHFPLSNLYESLVFLSWSLLISQVVLQQSTKQHALLLPLAQEGKAPPDNDNDKTGDLLKTQDHGSQGSRDQSITPARAEMILSDTSSTTDLTSIIGVVTSPIALLTYGFASLKLPKEMQQATALLPALQSNWLMMHVTVMILSYAALICGSILSMAFLLITRVASHAQTGKESQTPALLARGSRVVSRVLSYQLLEQTPTTDADNMGAVAGTLPASSDVSANNMQALSYLYLANGLDNLSYRLLGLGFPLLTVGILSGAVWANEAWGSYWSWDPKETWALITWLVFAIYLHARLTRGWNGQRPAIIATLGFFVVWFCYLGVNLLGTGLHSYGWFSSYN